MRGVTLSLAEPIAYGACVQPKRSGRGTREAQCRV